MGKKRKEVDHQSQAEGKEVDLNEDLERRVEAIKRCLDACRICANEALAKNQIDDWAYYSGMVQTLERSLELKIWEPIKAPILVGTELKLLEPTKVPILIEIGQDGEGEG